MPGRLAFAKKGAPGGVMVTIAPHPGGGAPMPGPSGPPMGGADDESAEGPEMVQCPACGCKFDANDPQDYTEPSKQSGPQGPPTPEEGA